MFSLVLMSVLALAIARPPQEFDLDNIYGQLPYLLERLEANGQSPRFIDEKPYVTLVADSAWPSSDVSLGQVAGVGTDKQGNVHVFHRAERSWTVASFGRDNTFQEVSKGPIKGDVLLELNKETGEVTNKWGADRFYMPHGLTIDHEGNVWLTDVALHQVLKFPKGSDNATLVLGEKFVPGNDDSHFCKPTDVAVASNGVFFVSDGYCNSRILKYSPDGTLIGQIGKPRSHPRLEEDNFALPHSLALIESQDLICVADRENGRIQCFKAGLVSAHDTGKFVASVDNEELSKVYAIAYDPNEKFLYAVNGDNRDMQAIQGFTINTESWEITDTWGPHRGFTTPHDLAVSPDGKHVYVAEIGPNKVWKMDKTPLH